MQIKWGLCTKCYFNLFSVLWEALVLKQLLPGVMRDKDPQIRQALFFFHMGRALISNEYRKHCMMNCIHFAWRHHLKIPCYNENKHFLVLYEILQELITVVKNVSRKQPDQEGAQKKKILIIRKLWSLCYNILIHKIY